VNRIGVDQGDRLTVSGNGPEDDVKDLAAAAVGLLDLRVADLFGSSGLSVGKNGYLIKRLGLFS